MDIDEDIRHYKNIFNDFIEEDIPPKSYKHRIGDLLRKGKKHRLLMSIDEIRGFNQDLAQTLMRQPTKIVVAFEEALKEVIQHEFRELYIPMRDNNAGILNEFHIGFEGNFGNHVVSPRRLLSTFLNSLVCVEGIVTKSTISIPQVISTVSYCSATNKFTTRNYRGATSLVGAPTSMAFPSEDEQGNPLTTEFGLCVYKDVQKLYIQEMPERAPAGQLPRSVECVVEEDLVDSVKPGDRVRLIGIYRPLTGQDQGRKVTSGTMKTCVLVNHLERIGVQTKMPTADEIKAIRALAKENDDQPKDSDKPLALFNLLSQSIAPSISGHDQIKQALLLQLFGGVEKNLEHGTHLRGDINILMVGDPGTAKSQLLRYMINLSPLAVSTSGKSSTGVGLTAAVVSDGISGEKTLQAGAMVLADRGLVCVDEFDKMVDTDRTAMHEVMEQQTVTIQKAGVHTTLNARCSVLAAANPIHSSYNRRLTVQKNVGLPDSLLSRFDLVFILLDHKNEALDRQIANHVLTMHQHRSGSELDPVIHTVDESERLELRIEEERASMTTTAFGSETYTTDFLRKYINYAKKRIQPQLTEEANHLITQYYVLIRDSVMPKTLPITPRCLEALIRLATAHAKMRLSRKIEPKDVHACYALLNFALFFNSLTATAESELKETPEDAMKEAQPPKKQENKPKESTVEQEEMEDLLMQANDEEEEAEDSDQEHTLATNSEIDLVVKSISDIVKRGYDMDMGIPISQVHEAVIKVVPMEMGKLVDIINSATLSGDYYYDDEDEVIHLNG